MTDQFATIEPVRPAIYVFSYEKPDRFLLAKTNPAATELHGVGRRLPKGVELGQLWPDMGVPEMRRVLVGVLASRETLHSAGFCWHDRQTDATYRVRALRLSARSLAITVDDVSSQKHAEARLKESAESLHILVEASFEGIAIHRDATVLLCNDAFSQMLGCDRSEIIGQNATKWTAPESRDLLMRNVRTNYEHAYEAVWVRSDGSRFCVEIRGKSCTYQGKVARVAAVRDISERKRAATLTRDVERLEQLSTTDGLTGLTNHRHFQTRLQAETERARRSNLALSLLMVDVDHFKRFNDRYGHPSGDTALREVARVLSDGRRINDLVCRYGGEEFAIVLPDTDGDAAEGLAERIRVRFTGQAESATKHLHGLTVSIGVASAPEDGSTAQDLLQSADVALYRAKRRGRNRVQRASRLKSRRPTVRVNSPRE